MSEAVFAYGSLVSSASTAETLARRAVSAELATLVGWRRRWTLARDNHRSEKGFALADGSMPPFCLALNLEPDRESEVYGALIEVDDSELERLDLREIRYRRVEVTRSVATNTDRRHGFTRVSAYVARPEHHRREPPGGAIVIASYLRAVESAFAEHGRAALERFRATTDPVPAGVEVVEARLVRDAIPAGNPRDW